MISRHEKLIWPRFRFKNNIKTLSFRISFLIFLTLPSFYKKQNIQSGPKTAADNVIRIHLLFFLLPSLDSAYMYLIYFLFLQTGVILKGCETNPPCFVSLRLSGLSTPVSLSTGLHDALIPENVFSLFFSLNIFRNTS